jgi:hypothetical protein
MTAAKMVLDRIYAPKRPGRDAIKFNLDTALPLLAQVKQVLRGMASGELDIESGKFVIDCLTAAAGIQQHTEFEERLNALEAAQRDGAPGALGGVMQLEGNGSVQ